MKRLLLFTAAIEIGVGIALLAVPALLVSVLLGGSLDSPAALTAARIAGAAVLALGVICWLTCRDAQNFAVAGVVIGMLLYNVVAFSVLDYAELGLRMHGIGLWPAVGLHAALAVWCIACLRRMKTPAPSFPMTGNG